MLLILKMQSHIIILKNKKNILVERQIFIGNFLNHCNLLGTSSVSHFPELFLPKCFKKQKNTTWFFIRHFLCFIVFVKWLNF